MLAALEAYDLAERLDFLLCILVASQEAPVLCNAPGGTFDLCTVSFDQFLRLLDILGHRLLGQDMLAGKQSSADIFRLVLNRQPEGPLG